MVATRLGHAWAIRNKLSNTPPMTHQLSSQHVRVSKMYHQTWWYPIKIREKLKTKCSATIVFMQTIHLVSANKQNTLSNMDMLVFSFMDEMPPPPTCISYIDELRYGTRVCGGMKYEPWALSVLALNIVYLRCDTIYNRWPGTNTERRGKLLAQCVYALFVMNTDGPCQATLHFIHISSAPGIRWLLRRGMHKWRTYSFHKLGATCCATI